MGPHLEHCALFRLPYFKEDIAELESYKGGLPRLLRGSAPFLLRGGAPFLLLIILVALLYMLYENKARKSGTSQSRKTRVNITEVKPLAHTSGLLPLTDSCYCTVTGSLFTTATTSIYSGL